MIVFLNLDIPYKEDFNKEMSEATGLPITTHDMMVEGICEDCLKKAVMLDATVENGES